MFTLLSKTLDLLADPWWWAVLLAAAGTVVLARTAKKRLGRGLVAAGFAVLVFFSLPSVANRLWWALEAGAQTTWRADVTYDVVVLLGGAADEFGSTRDTAAWNHNVDRLIATHALLASGKAKFVIVSGGSLGPAGLPTEAGFLAGQLEAWGIARERILVEAQANNTRENAVRSKALIDQQGFGSVLVVTSAFHLPRAVGCFRAVGQPVDTLAVDYRMRDPSSDSHLLPRSEYLFNSADALHELVGRLVYRVLGYSKP